MAPLTAVAGQGLQQGDLQTVVQALQALTIKLGDLINQLSAASTGLIDQINTSVADLVTATEASTAALTAKQVLPAVNQYFHIGAAASALVNTGATTLFGAVFNNADFTGVTFTTLTVYDGTTTGGAVVAAIAFLQEGYNYDFGESGIALTTGLYVVAAGTPCDITLIWNVG